MDYNKSAEMCNSMLNKRCNYCSELNRQKRKRCLAIAMWSSVSAAQMQVKHDYDPVRECKSFYAHRALWWSKWQNRWLELADNFKE